MSTLIIKNLGAFLHQISYQSQLVICFFLFFLISFLISSTSAFANATFPLLGPTVGLKHLASFVFVFSYANGLANLICPFSGVLMASLAVTQISYAKFVRVVAPLIGLYLCLSLILIITGSFLVGHNSIIF